MSWMNLDRHQDGTLLPSGERKLMLLLIGMILALISLLNVTVEQSFPVKVVHPRVVAIRPFYKPLLTENQTITLWAKNAPQSTAVQALHNIDASEVAVSLKEPVAMRGNARLIFDKKPVKTVLSQ